MHFFFFNDTATTEIYTLSLHDALPICTDRAETMLLALSTFFRTSLSLDPTADVTLSEEIDLQRLYLDIEKARFPDRDRKSTRLNSSHANISYAVFCLKKKNTTIQSSSN